ncbi:MAG TPA: MarR family winged helix-turn-helix transcriptional regulator [Stellaceae bacterium]|jgi:DNA-binding MarR family transcriptional regulator|nr:MarR family winged helix-turn-helix transcriptional regulator [Stellaceae bacterium]
MTSEHRPGTYRPPLTISRGDYLKGGSDTLFRESIYALIQCTSRLLACRDAFSKEMALTQGQFAVLMGVAYCQGQDGVTIKALADHVALASTHVTTDVGRLERMGLLVKAPNGADRRSVLVSLSEEGERHIAQVAPLVREINNLLFEGIDPVHLEIARQVSRSLVRNSEEAIATLRRHRRQGGQKG